MAKIPTMTRFAVEDFPKEKSWIGTLLSPLNSFLSVTVFALTRHLTFYDNFQGQENTLSFVYNGTVTLPLSFSNTMGATPGEVRIASALENGIPVAVIAAWTISQTGQIQLTDFTKFSLGTAYPLVMGATYQLTVRAMP